MMIFLLHHADNKWKKMCHDVCILNRKKKSYLYRTFVRSAL